MSNALIPASDVTAAMMRGPADVRPVGGLRVGIDVARSGNDKTVITFRRGRVLLKQIKLAKLDITEVAGRARAEIVAYGERPEQIAVDTIGVGAGVADVMRVLSDVIDKATGKRKPLWWMSIVAADGQRRDYNLRAFMWREMGEWLKPPASRNDNDLQVDLTSLRYSFREARCCRVEGRCRGEAGEVSGLRGFAGDDLRHSDRR